MIRPTELAELATAAGDLHPVEVELNLSHDELDEFGWDVPLAVELVGVELVGRRLVLDVRLP